MFPKIIHRKLYLLGLIILVVSLPLSNLGTSIGLIMLAANFLIEGNFAEKYRTFIANKTLQVATLIYMPLLISSLYSSNLNYILSDLRLWLPFILIPPVVALSPKLNKTEFSLVMLCFVISVFAATIIGLFRLQLYMKGEISDIREISESISHIRFSLMINLAIAVLLYFQVVLRNHAWYIKALIVAGVIWFVLFLLKLQALTGFVMLGLQLLILLWFVVRKSTNKSLRWSVILIVIAGFVAGGLYFTSMVNRFSVRHKVDYSQLPKFTQNGNPYRHDVNNETYENGYLVNINICEPEMRTAWNSRSSYSYDKLDKRGQPLRFTLRRYLASKNFTKDSVGVYSLDSTDISTIEHGYASVIYRERGQNLYPRIYELLWEVDAYANNGSVNGGSVIQRLVYTKAAWQVIKKNLWFGVGWGDVQMFLDQQYAKTNLAKEFWFMPHNQYITVWTGAGLCGLLIFLFALVYPFVGLKKYKNFLPLFFYSMVMVSMLFEDTFETHIGISFSVAFASILIFGYDFTGAKDADIEVDK